MMKRSSLGVLAVLVTMAAAGPAAAQNTRPPLPPMPPVPVRPTTPPDVRPPLPPTPPLPAVITNPRWIRQAAPEYPERAMARDIGRGHVRLECIVQTTSFLSNCQVLEEYPPGAGFAAAALAGAAKARVEPRTVNGVAERARVAFNVDFALAN